MGLTTLYLRRARTPSGAPKGYDYRLRLVDAQGAPCTSVGLDDSAPLDVEMLGLISATGADPGEIPLFPQAQLATPGGAPCWWELTLRVTGSKHVDVWRLSVPESEVPLSLLDLITAAQSPVDPAASLVARLAALEANQLPAGSDGDILIHQDGAWRASDELPLN